MPWNKEEILERSEVRKSVLDSSPSEGGFCSSETKHDRRMVRVVCFDKDIKGT
jgi:hypothetical protein